MPKIRVLPLEANPQKHTLPTTAAFPPNNGPELKKHVKQYIDCAATTNDEVQDCPDVREWGDIGTWDVSNVNNMNFIFAIHRTFNEAISDWDVSRVTQMSSMFKEAKSFNTDISKWDVSNVKSMGEMFLQAQAFNQDISQWDVSRVTDFSEMFNKASAFNQDISDWQVTSANDMSKMFYNAKAFSHELCGAWARTKSTPNINTKDMFLNSRGSICESAQHKRTRNVL